MKSGSSLPAWLSRSSHPKTDALADTSAGLSTPAPTRQVPVIPANATPGMPDVPSHSGMRAKLTQFFKPSKLYNTPALQLQGPWAPALPASETGKVKDKGRADEAAATGEAAPEGPAASQIATLWLMSKRAHAREEISVVAVSRLKALEYERKNLATIPTEQRIWQHEEDDDSPGMATRLARRVMTDGHIASRERKEHKKTYHDEVIRTLLEAVGEQDIDAVLESFKQAGTGGLHRHSAALLTSTANIVNAAQQFSPEPISKAVLTGVRLALILASGERAFSSWEKRVGNAQTEELMVKGRADATHSAKIAPDILGASWNVLTKAWTTKKTAQSLERVSLQVAEARKAHEKADTTATKAATARVLAQAESKLRRLHAKSCYQIAARSQAKDTVESMKIELIGNKRYIQASLGGSAATTTASMIAIAAPLMGAAAAPVTGGLSAAAALIALSLYVAYHFSTAPSDDGVRKAQRAIVALAKSSDLFSDARIDFDTRRIQAHETYLEQRGKARWIGDPVKRDAAKQRAKDTLDATLLTIQQEEADAKPAVTPKQNWESYRKHEKKRNGLATDAEKLALDETYAKAHDSEFRSDRLASAWKDPISMRIDTGRKLFSGKIAQAHKRLLKLDKLQKTSTVQEMADAGLKPQDKKDKKRAELVAELQQALSDLLNLEAAEKEIKKAVKMTPAELGIRDDASEADNDAALDAALAPASRCLAAIQDEEFRALFCGDTDAQVAASKKAKLLTVGEGERYKWTNFGGTAVVVGVGASVVTADLGIAIAKALPPDAPLAHPAAAADPNAPPPPPPEKPTGQYHGLKFADYKFLALQTTGASVNGHYNAGSRAKFRDVDMKQLMKTVEKQVDTFTANLPWPKNKTIPGAAAANVVADLTEDQDLVALGPQVFDDDDMTGLLDDFVKQQRPQLSEPETFADELKNLLALLAQSDDFAKELGITEDTPVSIDELKQRVAEILKRASFAAILDVPEAKDMSSADIQERAAELLDSKFNFTANVDTSADGVFTARQMEDLVDKLLQGKSLPKKFAISVGDSATASAAVPPIGTSASATPPAARKNEEFSISLEKTTPFQRMQYKEGSFGDKFRFRKKQTAIAGRQVAIALLGIPAHLLLKLARVRGVPLDRMKEARNTGANMLKGTDEETFAMMQWLEDLSETQEQPALEPAKKKKASSAGKAREISGTALHAQERLRNVAPHTLLREEDEDDEDWDDETVALGGKNSYRMTPVYHSTSKATTSGTSTMATPVPPTRPQGIAEE